MSGVGDFLGGMMEEGEVDDDGSSRSGMSIGIQLSLLLLLLVSGWD